MMKNYLAVGLLLLTFWLIGYYAGKSLSGEVTPVYLTRTTKDTVWIKGKDSLIYRPKVVRVMVPDTVEIPGYIDSMAVAIDYFTRRYCVDTLANDSALLVVVYDSVYKNQLTNRKRLILRNYPVITQTINITTATDASGLYVGGSVGYGGFGLGIDYLYKNQLFGLDVTSNKQVLFTYKKRLWTKNLK